MIHLLDGWRWHDPRVWSPVLLACALAVLSSAGAALAPRSIVTAGAALLTVVVLAESAATRALRLEA
jgi:hypothetical protein